jgi:hypothetical protein
MKIVRRSLDKCSFCSNKPVCLWTERESAKTSVIFVGIFLISGLIAGIFLENPAAEILLGVFGLLLFVILLPHNHNYLLCEEHRMEFVNLRFDRNKKVID